MPINIIVAHGLEAKALVPLLGLERQETQSKYVQYSNAEKLCLLVSGIGKDAVSSAVAYLAEQQSNDEGEIRAWLNVGIAGHRDAALGSGWLGNKISDQDDGHSAYPPQLIDGVQVGAVVTVTEPENSYPLDAAYEMEASAFYAEATKHSTAELVQVYKIISDNRENPLSEIDLKSVPNLIANHAGQLESLLAKMSRIVDEHNGVRRLPKAYAEICSKTRQTVSQNLQLKRLCQRYKALGLEEELNSLAALELSDARQLIQQLSEHLREV